MLHQTDKWLALAFGLTLVLWVVNIFLSAVWVLYVNLLLVSGILGYTAWKADPLHELRNAWLIGMVACLVYAYIDSLLSSLRFGMVFHLKTADLEPFGATPLSLILLWGCLITMVLYFYQRMRTLWHPIWPALLLTAVAAFVGGFLFELLGNVAHLWNWNADQIRSGYLLSVPLVVPISYAFSALFAPYVLKNVLVGGLRCGVVIGVVRFGGFVIIRYLSVGV